MNAYYIEPTYLCPTCQIAHVGKCPLLVSNKHWKLYIDLKKIASDVDFVKIIEMILPNLAEPYFVGFRFLMARYDNDVAAYARALDIECSGLYCASIEVEEVSA